MRSILLLLVVTMVGCMTVVQPDPTPTREWLTDWPCTVTESTPLYQDAALTMPIDGARVLAKDESVLLTFDRTASAWWVVTTGGTRAAGWVSRKILAEWCGG